MTIHQPTGKRIAIVEACRIPFAKAYGAYKDYNAQDLINLAVRGLLDRVPVEKEGIDEIIASAVMPVVASPNLAREIVFDLNLPLKIPGFTLGRACASSLQSTISAGEGILSGNYETVISCGAESLSNVPILFKKEFVEGLLKLRNLAKAKSPAQKFSLLSNALSHFKPSNWAPVAPAIAERYTGLSMGQHSEIMAKKNGISRKAQDDLAYLSHLRAAKAIESGKMAEEIVPVFLPNSHVFQEDDGVRKNPDRASLDKLKPVFDRKYGTVTAANSSPLTDGASAALIMREDKAKSLGLPIKGYLKAWATTALDPNDQLLIAPAISTPMALKRAGLSFQDIQLFEVHEAFASQVLSFTQALASRKFAETYLGQSEAVGEINPDLMNVNGGSISIGHPFGATGIRLIASLLNEMKRRNLKYGLATACAAGAIGTTIILETDV